MNYDQILDKPFLVTTIPWSTSNISFTELWRLPFPSSIMSNPLAKVPFNASTFFQAKMCCMLQVSGTPMHQGLILVAAVPHTSPRVTNCNQILSAPHVFLNATESTSVCLECPMYTPSTLYRTQDPTAADNNSIMHASRFGSDVFDLVFYVMDSLSVSSGSSTSISISVHCIFKEAQFYVPKVGLLDWQPQCGVEKLWAFKSKAKVSTQCACGEKRLSEDKQALSDKQDSEFVAEGFLTTNLWKLPTKILDDFTSGLKAVTGDIIDYGRGVVKTLTGFHNPNDPVIEQRVLSTFRNFPNNVDQPVHLEVMDNHAQFSRIYDDYYFRTEQDEMDLKFLTSKPVYVGKFAVSSTDVAGKNLFAYPMTPMVEASVSIAQGETSGNTTFYSPLRTIYEASRFWRGDLKMHIQAVCTNFHFCKIIVLKNYAMTSGPISATHAVVPAFNNIHNINTDTLEFSAGGQIQTIDLKYNSNLRQLECTKDYTLNAISHGIAYGYLVQPLTYNANVPTSIEFNVYISGGDNLQFSGYAVDSVDVIGGDAPIYPGIPNFFQNEPGIYEVNEDGSNTGKIIKSEDIKKVSLKVRKSEFFAEKPTEYVVQEGDEWEDVAFITGNSLETLRNLNAETHNPNSKYYSMMKGPLLTKGEKLRFQKLWKRRSEDIPLDSFVPETLEKVEGTNALVSPNVQDAVLNQPTPCDEDIKMAFRPNTSVRDYLRFMYPQATVKEEPTKIKNVVAFDLYRLINSYTNADYFQAIHSLYMGISGGFKLKFKISGVANASAVFQPPSSCAVNGNDTLIRTMSPFLPTNTSSLNDFLSGTTYNPDEKSFTAPQIEMQDYTRPHNNAGTTVSSRPGSSFVLEMAIPNMNPYNFTGNPLKWFNLYNNSVVDPENDFGVIYINYDASYDGNSYSPVEIIPFIGINDETRLGFQVYAPRKELPTYITSAPVSTICRSSILHPREVTSVLPDGIPIKPMPLIGSSYYFNS
jgi:hypothetical protein